MALTTGTRLGPYEIVATLGAGGMGEVYRARDARLGRDVAVKVLPEAFAADPDRLRRFAQEARAAAALNHANILAVYDVGAEERVSYLVAELLEGDTLRARLQQAGALPLKKTLEIAGQIARGLAAAHDRGIVHRDLKPENVFLTRDGTVKILDFGLAKLVEPAGAPAGASVLPTGVVPTVQGLVLGTVGYMAPEQVRGEPVDHRADIFSLGAVLYEMLAGARAFGRPTAPETLMAILNEDPPDRALADRGVPAVLEGVLRRCLEKNPAERFQSAHDLAFNLQPLTAASGAVSTAPPHRRAVSPRVMLAAAAAIAVSAASFTTGRLTGGTDRLEPPRFQRLTFRRGNILHAGFAPDGQTVVYGAAWDDSPAELFVTRTDTVESRPLGIPRSDLLAVSSKGELAILLKRDALRTSWGTGMLARMPLTGGTPREVIDGVMDADWSPDGAELGVARSIDESWQIEYPIGRVLHRGAVLVRGIRISPDGMRVAFLEGERLLIADANGVAHTFPVGLGSGGWPVWSADGREIYYTSGRDPQSRELRAFDLDGRARLVLRSPDLLLLHRFDHTGRALIERETIRAGLLAGRFDEASEREMGWLDHSVIADLGRDGTVLLFSETGEGAGDHAGVYLRRADTPAAVRLGDGLAQALSPDGRWALAANTNGRGLVLLPTGAGRPRALSTEPVTLPLNPLRASARFFPDGRRILFPGRDADGRMRLYVQSIDGGPPRAIPADDVASFAVLSPDGRQAAFHDSALRLVVVDVERGGATQVAQLEPGELPVRWTEHGRALLVAQFGELTLPVVRIDLATGGREIVHRLRPADAAGVIRIDWLAIAGDERHYAYTASRMVSSDLYLVEGIR